MSEKQTMDIAKNKEYRFLEKNKRIMAPSAFGKTWWGSEWLKSLTYIDYANRIPRGSAYARKGAVKSIDVKDNVIMAKVSGSRPTPYRVTIQVPLFKPEQIDLLMEKLLEQPSLISKLLNRKLDPEVFRVAKCIGLNLFPQRWSDLAMHCSCPDWAVPCKHLAAVIYMMSREIDNDPFLVFSMHGVNLLEELKKRHVEIEKEQVMDVPEFASLLERRMPKEMGHDLIEFHRVDFSRLHDIAEPLANLLTASPAFCPKGDFQQVYKAEMVRMARNARRILQGNSNLDMGLPGPTAGDITRSDEVRFEIDGDIIVQQSYVFYGKADFHRPLPTDDDFIAALYRLPDDYLSDYSPSVAAMHQALFCALHLLANGAVVPQIVRLSGVKTYAIRWLPAMIDGEVAQMMSSLESIMPQTLMEARLPKRKLAVALKNQTEHIVSYLLERLILCLSASAGGDTFRELFFKSQPKRFDAVGETAIPGGIRSWLDRFFLSQRQYHPMILISESDFGEFALDVAIGRDGENVLLKDILHDSALKTQRFAILKELSLLSSLVRGLETYIDRDGATPIFFTAHEFTSFLFDAIPAIRLLGVKVMLPKSLQKIIRPKVSVRLSKKQTDGKSYLRLDEMLQFDWQVALGDEVVSSQEFAQLIRRARGLIKFRQQYIYVSEEDIARLQHAFEGNRPMTATQMLQAALTESYDRAPIILTDEVRQLIRQLTEQADIPVPADIHATLRPYQERGFSWMYRNFRIGFGSIIADDMGLGKTLQVITLLQKLKDDGALRPSLGKATDRRAMLGNGDGGGSALIVVPTGLVTNWQSELHRFAPSLSVFTYHGTQRNLKAFTSPREGQEGADILLTTYGVLRSDAAKLKKLSWLAVIIDEAQNIKNADTAQSKAVRSIPAKLHVAMSGTPVENRLSEFWSIMDFANQGYLGTANAFKQTFANPIQREGDRLVADRFRRITAPFLLRRLKSDKSIISDLPDKIEQNELALLTERQAALYQETLEQAMQAIEGIDATDHQSLFVRQGLVLQMILALKQICNHPALFLKNGDFNPELSGKTEMLLSLLESIVESGQKVLVFTQFREMGDMLVQMIEQRLGEKPLFLHGGCSIKERQTMVDRFQTNSRGDRIFLLSLKAAGTGLNLTAASHVIHYDLWWNPAVEAQATDRAYRIGQHQNVVVHRFITQNTFEERIDQMIQDKRHLADITVASGESWIGKLSNSELREIFSPPLA